jgi:methylglutaconyl-CoA hydratase
MSDDRVLMDLSDGILGLTLNRPDKRNALDTPAVDGLRAALERAELDAAVRVVALRGAGPDFCAGADLAELLASADETMAENEAHAMRLGDVFVGIRDLPKPVVGIVHGRALAGGCGLASACDIVLAHETATFGYPEVRRGFVPAMVMAMLRRAVGEKVAVDLVMTGRLLSADEAAGVGLVSRVIAAGQFDQETGNILRQLAEGSPSALALIKRQLYELDGLRFAESIALGARVNATARSTPDFAAAVARFLDKA